MKPLKDDIPIEPLSEPRWKKIDEAVFAALDAEDVRSPSSIPAPMQKRAENGWNSRRVMYVASAFAVAAVILAFVLRAVLSHDKSDEAINPSHIETGAEPSRLAIGESSIEIGKESAVVASGDAEHGVLVVLEKGRVECEVAPRKGRPPFVVQAGDVRVRVVGTRFSVTRNAKEIHVAVTHGTVEVSGASEVVLLHDGDTWPRATTSNAPATSAPSSVDSQIESAPTLTAPSVNPSATAPATTASAQMSDQRVYENAARSEAHDPDAAMSAYRKLASSGGPWASTALFAEGRLAADRGKKADARKYLEKYLARYPQGPNADDARRILGQLD